MVKKPKKKLEGTCPNVSIRRCGEYAPQKAAVAVTKAVDEIGGIDRFIKKGNHVLIKPNLLISSSVDKHVTTHPEIVRAVIKLVKKAGGKPRIGDSPAMGSAKKVSSKCGIADVAKEEHVEIVNFNSPVEVSNPAGIQFKKFKLDRAVLETDAIISLPKLKTHGQMTLTLGVKNMFGAVPGTRKSQWHLAAGTDRLNFGRMLVDLYQRISPRLTIMDGIIGMHGNGPQNGDPKKIGLVMASEDAVALDAVICEIVGLKRDRMPTTLAAEEMGVGETRLDRISITGESIENSRIEGFVFPETGDLMSFFPGFLREPLRDWLTTRPVVDSDKCEMCLICAKNCPANVITSNKNSLRFDLKQCIRCFCCQEMCPEGAISVGVGPLAKVLRL
jgi:uncharacterized protein (DUF362 family)/Pyruvate/2-oxoacid:ferredoxin oxidoreductase delta subunit